MKLILLASFFSLFYCSCGALFMVLLCVMVCTVCCVLVLYLCGHIRGLLVYKCHHAGMWGRGAEGRSLGTGTSVVLLQGLQAPQGLPETNWLSCCSWHPLKTTSGSCVPQPCCPQRVLQGPKAPTGVLPLVFSGARLVLPIPMWCYLPHCCYPITDWSNVL